MYLVAGVTPGIHLPKKDPACYTGPADDGFFQHWSGLSAGMAFVFHTHERIILIGMWLYEEQKPGEFLRTQCLVIGTGRFDLGSGSEMGLQSPFTYCC